MPYKKNPQLHINFTYSLYLSQFHAYHSINKNVGKITCYLAKIWHGNQCNEAFVFTRFVPNLIGYELLERICLERANLRIRIKNRCKPTCKLQPIVSKMMEWSGYHYE